MVVKGEAQNRGGVIAVLYRILKKILKIFPLTRIILNRYPGLGVRFKVRFSNYCWYYVLKLSGHLNVAFAHCLFHLWPYFGLVKPYFMINHLSRSFEHTKSSKTLEKLNTIKEALRRAIDPDAGSSHVLMTFVGWAYSQQLGQAAKSVVVVENDRVCGEAKCDIFRPDVNMALNLPSQITAGFSVTASVDLSKIDSYRIVALFGQGHLGNFSDTTHCKLLRETLDPRELGSLFNTRNMLPDKIGWVDKCEYLDSQLPRPAELLKLFDSDAGYRPVIRAYCVRDDLQGAKEAIELVRSELPTGISYNLLRVLRPHLEKKPKGYTILPVKPAGTYEFHHPRIFPGAMSLGNPVRIQKPAEEIFILKDADIIFNSSVILGKKEYFLLDRSADPHFEFIAGLHLCQMNFAQNYDYTILFGEIRKTRRVQKAILLDCRTAMNYFHWLIECLPRLMVIESRKELNKLPLIVSAHLPASMKEMLKIISPKRKIIYRKLDERLTVKTLYVPGMLTYMPDSLDISFDETACIPTEYLREIRQRLMSREIQKIKPHLKLYLSRPGYSSRSILNGFEIEEIAVKAGFTIVEPSTLSLAEQIRLFASAKVVAGAAGAAFANILFCQPGCSVICLIINRNTGYSLFQNIATASGADFVYVAGKSEKPKLSYATGPEYFHSKYYIKPGDFRRAIRQFS